MRFDELQDLAYNLSGDPERKQDPGFIRLLLNTGCKQFVKATGILRYRAQIAIVSGVGQLDKIPDGVNMAGRILRVEDANAGNRRVTFTTEDTLDVLPGPDWRQTSSGPIKNWLRGTPRDNQTGFGTILTYPAVSGLLDVYFIKEPKVLRDDADVSDIPEMFHIAPVWYAVQMLLRTKPSEALKEQLAYAMAEWQAEIERAAGEVGAWQTQQGAA